MLVDRELAEPNPNRPFYMVSDADGMLPLVETNDARALAAFVRWALEEDIFAQRACQRLGPYTVLVEMEHKQDLDRFIEIGHELQEILERDFEGADDDSV